MNIEQAQFWNNGNKEICDYDYSIRIQSIMLKLALVNLPFILWWRIQILNTQSILAFEW
jgi:hypothetical protein